MKLVEILARELSEWPTGVMSMSQDADLQFSHYESKDQIWSDNLGAWNNDGYIPCSRFRIGKLATDHSTAIVTREMWQAERDKQAAIQVGIDAANTGCLKPLSEVKARYNGPTQWRDRIRAIDLQIHELTLERAERVAELAAEGFALLPVVDAVDMEDWRNWQAGDLLEVVDIQDEHHSFKVGDVIEMLKHDTNLRRPAHYCKSSDDDYGWVMADKMKFHSRPKPC